MMGAALAVTQPCNNRLFAYLSRSQCHNLTMSLLKNAKEMYCTSIPVSAIDPSMMSNSSIAMDGISE